MSDGSTVTEDSKGVDEFGTDTVYVIIHKPEMELEQRDKVYRHIIIMYGFIFKLHSIKLDEQRI